MSKQVILSACHSAVGNPTPSNLFFPPLSPLPQPPTPLPCPCLMLYHSIHFVLCLTTCCCPPAVCLAIICSCDRLVVLLEQSTLAYIVSASGHKQPPALLDVCPLLSKTKEHIHMCMSLPAGKGRCDRADKNSCQGMGCVQYPVQWPCLWLHSHQADSRQERRSQHAGGYSASCCITASVSKSNYIT